eukprot:11733778-Heterocapsa_arctica.AAC.1
MEAVLVALAPRDAIRSRCCRYCRRRKVFPCDMVETLIQQRPEFINVHVIATVIESVLKCGIRDPARE